MEATLISMHSGDYQPYTNAALGDTRRTAQKKAAERTRRTQDRQFVKEAERKLRDELMRKYKPLLDEELWWVPF